MQNSDFFFFYKRKYGYSLHFCHDTTKNNFNESNLYEMQLKQDFHERLRESGMLPSADLNVKMELQGLALL